MRSVGNSSCGLVDNSSGQDESTNKIKSSQAWPGTTTYYIHVLMGWQYAITVYKKDVKEPLNIK